MPFPKPLRLIVAAALALAAAPCMRATVSFHSCVLMARGAVSCWGSNDFGQTGNRTIYTASNVPIDVDEPITVPALSSGILSIGAGGYHTCAVLQGASPSIGASAVCWGKNDVGQLGIGSSAPVLTSTGTTVLGLNYGVASLAAAFEHTCALMVNGSVFCWGSNTFGQLGLGFLNATGFYNAPMPVVNLPSPAIHVAAGGYHTCALLHDGAVMCWGSCQQTQIGDNTAACGAAQGRPSPAQVHGLGSGSGVVRIAAGRLHSCALMSNGTAMCWGDNAYGQLGDGTYKTSVSQLNLSPRFVVGASDAIAITCGYCHTCLLRSNGQPMCWGCNSQGQLGNGAFANGFSTSSTSPGTCRRVSPQDVCVASSSCTCSTCGLTVSCDTVLSGIVAVVAGREHTCARHINGTLFCWGYNFEKELTSACASTRCTRPVLVTGLSSQVLDVWDQPALSSVFSVAFNVSDADRTPGNVNATATFAFTTQTEVHAGGTITLNYPAAFFAPDVTPSSIACNVPGLSFAAAATSAMSLLLTTTSLLPSASAVVITVYGLTMGAATEGSAAGITVQTSADVAVSLAAPSGAIEGRVTGVVFQIATADRIAGNNNATVTLTFTPFTAVQDFQNITLNYPHAFFFPGIHPFVAASNTLYAADNFKFNPTTNTSLVFTLSAASLPASSPFIITLSGVTLGAATDGSLKGITVQTSSDTGHSLHVDSGAIFISLVPVAVSASPSSPLVGGVLTVHGHSFILPGIPLTCTATIGPSPSSAVNATCTLLSSSRAVVLVPNNAMIAPSYVQLLFEPGNYNTTAATRLCPCSHIHSGTVCGCAVEACARRG